MIINRCGKTSAWTLKNESYWPFRTVKKFVTAVALSDTWFLCTTLLEHLSTQKIAEIYGQNSLTIAQQQKSRVSFIFRFLSPEEILHGLKKNENKAGHVLSMTSRHRMRIGLGPFLLSIKLLQNRIFEMPLLGVII